MRNLFGSISSQQRGKVVVFFLLTLCRFTARIEASDGTCWGLSLSLSLHTPPCILARLVGHGSQIAGRIVIVSFNFAIFIPAIRFALVSYFSNRKQAVERNHD